MKWRTKDGVPALWIKHELLALEARKAELQYRLDAPEMPELLHPRMADVYREKVGSLRLALEGEESRTGALAGMLSAARGTKRSPDTGDLFVQIKLVVGACNPLNLEFSWSAA